METKNAIVVSEAWFRPAGLLGVFIPEERTRCLRLRAAAIPVGRA